MDKRTGNQDEGQFSGEVNTVLPERDRGGRGRGFGRGVFTGILLSILTAGVVLLGRGLYIRYQIKQADTASVEGGGSALTPDAMQKLRTIEEVIDQYYYKEDIEPGVKQDGMYKGLVASLGDPYSVYYTGEELDSMIDQTKGIYFGIGAYVKMDPELNMAMLKEVIADSPAEEAGLKGGDVIYKVEGEYTQGLELQEVVSRIKGEEGTTVHLTIYREGESDYLEFDVERRELESLTVEHRMLEDGMGYLLIREFDDVTVEQFNDAMADLRASGMKGLILDLRGNPGGNLNTVTEIARQILPKGLIVYTEDRDGERTEYTCDGTHELDIPLVVLVDGASASASEILAGAVKDYGIGTLVGTKTFGKGIVQKILSLSDGTAVKLTVSSYFTPKGNNIHGIGIEPDELCKFDAEAYYGEGIDNQLEQAKEVLAGKMNE